MVQGRHAGADGSPDECALRTSSELPRNHAALGFGLSHETFALRFRALLNF